MVGHNVVDLAAERGIEVVAPPRRELDLKDAGRRACLHAAASGPRSSFTPPAGSAVSRPTCASRSPSSPRTGTWAAISFSLRGEAGVMRLINLGSSCMYPKDIERPIREEDLFAAPFEPTNEAYAIAKCAVQRLCAYIGAEAPEFAYKTLIPCNLYGRYDNFDPWRSHLAAASDP